ncbi:hypothetical protein C8J56DRAFT_769752, partial [Mycena floridula]
PFIYRVCGLVETFIARRPCPQRALPVLMSFGALIFSIFPYPHQSLWLRGALFLLEHSSNPNPITFLAR